MKIPDSFRLGGSSEEDVLLRMTSFKGLLAGLITKLKVPKNQ
jgi:hypothetical protein